MPYFSLATVALTLYFVTAPDPCQAARVYPVTTATLPVPGMRYVTAVHDQPNAAIYLIGGIAEVELGTSMIHRFDLNTGTFSTVGGASANSYRTFGGTPVMDNTGKIFYLGGYYLGYDTHGLADIWMVDTASTNQSASPSLLATPLPFNETSPCAAFVSSETGGSIFAFSGLTGLDSTYDTRIIQYSLGSTSNSATAIRSSPSTANFAQKSPNGCAQVGSDLYVFGGYSIPTTILPGQDSLKPVGVKKLRLGTNKVETVLAAAQFPNGGLMYTSAVTAGTNTVYLVGGCYPGTYMENPHTLSVFDVQKKTVTPVKLTRNTGQGDVEVTLKLINAAVVYVETATTKKIFVFEYVYAWMRTKNGGIGEIFYIEL